MAHDMPADLDSLARKKWRELIDLVDPDVDGELLANYCRQHATLLAIRSEKAKQIKAKTFDTMVRGRDSTMVLNPLLVTENRVVAALNRMLRTLGLAPSRDQQENRKRKPPSNPPPPGFSGPEPRHGWAIELALCGQIPILDGVETEADRRRQANEKLLAEKDWRAYERDYEGGKNERN